MANDGGPAFPQTADSWYRRGNGSPVPEGMSLRDWFAGQALAELVRASIEQTVDDFGPNEVAHYAYAHADAMLKAREVPRGRA